MEVVIPTVSENNKDVRYKKPRVTSSGAFDSVPKGMIKERNNE
jgi:hypothetical protein